MALLEIIPENARRISADDFAKFLAKQREDLVDELEDVQELERRLQTAISRLDAQVANKETTVDVLGVPCDYYITIDPDGNPFAVRVARKAGAFGFLYLAGKNEHE